MEKGKKIKDRKEGNSHWWVIAKHSHGMVVPRGSTGANGKRSFWPRCVLPPVRAARKRENNGRQMWKL